MQKDPLIIRKTYGDIEKIKRPSKLSEEAKRNILEKLFQKNPEIFSSEKEIQEKVRNRLDWVEGPNYIIPKIKEILNFAEEIKKEFLNVVWCGMGGSALFPLVISEIFTSQEGYPKFYVLDTNDPEIIAQIESLSLENTLFIIVSKSGTTIETISHFKYFWKKLEGIKSNPGSNFVALTDPGSPLEKLAKELNFRKIFHHPPFIGGRYAALSEIGFLPLALMGLNIERALKYAKDMYSACLPDIPWEYNLGSSLAEFLVENYIRGYDKLTFICDPQIKSFVLWLEQLIAESLGKEYTGIVPIVGESPGSPTVYGSDRAFIYLVLKERQQIYQRLISELKEEGFPVKTIFLEDKYEIFGEVFRWMVAVALCGYFMNLNPFDEPDVVLTKQKTKEILDNFKKEKDFGIEFYLDEETKWGFFYDKTVNIEYPKFTALLKKFFKDLSPWTYIGFLAYLPIDSEIEDIFRDLRGLVRDKKNCSTVFGFGPRYLHSTGQLYKGGPPLSRFMIFTRKGKNPKQIIPDEGYTFWDQQFAQAYGDFRALEEKKKPVIMIHLTENYKEDLKNFYTHLEKALSFE